MADQREPVLPYERRVADLARTYAAAQREIAAEVRAAITAGNLTRATSRRAQLAAVLAALDQLGAATDPVARELVREAYTQSAAHTLTQINALTVTAPEIPGAFASVNQPALAALEDSVTGRLRDSRATIGRSVNDAYGRAGRQAAVRSILGADASPRTAARQLASELAKTREVKQAMRSGGAALIDRGGKRWSLSTYSEMVVRTVTREAVVQGSVDRMAAHGIDLARVSRHGGSCTICVPYEGKLVSLDGQTRDYQGEPVMDSSILPPYHPNCRHTIQPVAVRIEAIRRELVAQEA